MRETVINAFVALLSGITGVKRVTRQFEGIDEIADSSFPCLIVEDDQPEVVNYSTGDAANVTLTLNVIGYVRDNAAVSTAINNLDKALIQQIASDQALGGSVMISHVDSSNERSGSQFQPFGYFSRPVKITYNASYTGGL